MRHLLVITFSLALGIAVVGGDGLKDAKDYPPPPPVPSSAAIVKTTPSTVKTTTTATKVTTVKTTIKTKKPVPEVKKPKKHKGPKLEVKPKVVKKPVVEKKPKLKVLPAQRRDSSYGAPAAPSYGAPAPPKRQVIIKPAGPSKQFGWIGHGRYAPVNIKSPFPKDLPKWIPMGNNIFEAGLLYPGKPGGAQKAASSSYSPPPAAPAQESYGAPQASNTYESPAPPPPVPSYETQDSYSAPQPAASPEIIYAPPQPQPVYPKATEAPPSYAQPSLPPEIPAQPAYQSNVPSYGQSTLLGQIYDPEPANAYSAPAAPVTAVPAYTTPRPSYPTTPASYTPAQPTYNNNVQPFTAFGSTAHQSTFSSYPSTTAQPTYNVPAIETAYQPVDKPGNFPTFNTLPGFAGQTYLEPSQNTYEAQGSIQQTKTVGAPSVNSFNAYDVPLKVEETYNTPAEEDQDVYFIFYEDPNTPIGSSVSYPFNPKVNKYNLD